MQGLRTGMAHLTVWSRPEATTYLLEKSKINLNLLVKPVRAIAIESLPKKRGRPGAVEILSRENKAPLNPIVLEIESRDVLNKAQANGAHTPNVFASASLRDAQDDRAQVQSLLMGHLVANMRKAKAADSPIFLFDHLLIKRVGEYVLDFTVCEMGVSGDGMPSVHVIARTSSAAFSVITDKQAKAMAPLRRSSLLNKLHEEGFKIMNFGTKSRTTGKNKRSAGISTVRAIPSSSNILEAHSLQSHPSKRFKAQSPIHTSQPRAYEQIQPTIQPFPITLPPVYPALPRSIPQQSLFSAQNPFISNMPTHGFSPTTTNHYQQSQAQSVLPSSVYTESPSATSRHNSWQSDNPLNFTTQYVASYPGAGVTNHQYQYNASGQQIHSPNSWPFPQQYHQNYGG